MFDGVVPMANMNVASANSNHYDNDRLYVFDGWCEKEKMEEIIKSILLHVNGASFKAAFIPFAAYLDMDNDVKEWDIYAFALPFGMKKIGSMSNGGLRKAIINDEQNVLCINTIYSLAHIGHIVNGTESEYISCDDHDARSDIDNDIDDIGPSTGEESTIKNLNKN